MKTITIKDSQGGFTGKTVTIDGREIEMTGTYIDAQDLLMTVLAKELGIAVELTSAAGYVRKSTVDLIK